jgi:hypothetical protein
MSNITNIHSWLVNVNLENISLSKLSQSEQEREPTLPTEGLWIFWASEGFDYAIALLLKMWIVRMSSDLCDYADSDK